MPGGESGLGGGLRDKRAKRQSREGPQAEEEKSDQLCNDTAGKDCGYRRQREEVHFAPSGSFK